MGKLDNTLIIYIAGDNGNSAEGSLTGTPNEVASLQGVDVPVQLQLERPSARSRSISYVQRRVTSLSGRRNLLLGKIATYNGRR
jgi:hypothetical protein